MMTEDLHAEIERQRQAKEIHYAETVRLEREVERLTRERDAAIETSDRNQRNRDMWKGQCERQAEELTHLRGAAA